MGKKVSLICFGSGINPQIQELYQSYLKRLRLLSPQLHLIENLNHDPIRQKMALDKKIASLSQQKHHSVILLREEGKVLNSTTFATWIHDHLQKSSHLIFVIGPHQGFSASFLETYPASLSLSAMTFPHQMVPLILIEQLYRAETLIENRPYHY